MSFTTGDIVWIGTKATLGLSVLFAILRVLGQIRDELRRQNRRENP